MMRDVCKIVPLIGNFSCKEKFVSDARRVARAIRGQSSTVDRIASKRTAKILAIVRIAGHWLFVSDNIILGTKHPRILMLHQRRTCIRTTEHGAQAEHNSENYFSFFFFLNKNIEPCTAIGDFNALLTRKIITTSTGDFGSEKQSLFTTCRQLDWFESCTLLISFILSSSSRAT